MSDKYEYHVTFGEKKDIFTVQEKSDLKKLLTESFGIQEPSSCIKFQVYIPEWEDWCNKTLNDLPRRAKLRISVDSSEDSGTNDLQGETSEANPIKRPSTSKMIPSPGRQIWPAEYKFPEYIIPAAMISKIKNTGNLDSKDRKRLLDGLYNDVSSKYTLYPTTLQYHRIATALLSKFPMLDGALAGSDRMKLWKMRIQTKFQNSRKRLDYDLPEVSVHKRKLEEADDETAEAKNEVTPHSSSRWGIKNYLPPDPVGEDVVSIDIKIQWLQQEHSKSRPDMMKVNRYMAATFPRRRNLLVCNEDLSIKEVKTTFPWLFRREGLTEEYQRLQECDPIKTFLQALNEIGAQLLNKAQQLKNKPALFESILRSSNRCCLDNNEKKYATAIAALLANMYIMKEDPEDMIYPETEVTKGSITVGIACISELENIVDCDNFQVVVDGSPICAVDNFIDAVVCLMVSFYVFNVEYPKKLKNTLSFWQIKLLKVQDSKPPNRVLTLLAKLGR